MKQDESLASEGSSFAKELRQLSRAVSASTRRSLVLLDEVGKGCRADEGAGLFGAAIAEFLCRSRECPIVLSATHHLEAIRHTLPTTLPLCVGHMQTVLLPSSQASSFDADQLTFLYRFAPGMASSSLACHCAALCGVPLDVVQRACEIVADPAAAARPTIEEDKERTRREEAAARAFVEWEPRRGVDWREAVERLLSGL
ncbi:hypothetical protein ACQY0O_003964 [Thecaphora frezii]